MNSLNIIISFLIYSINSFNVNSLCKMNNLCKMNSLYKLNTNKNYIIKMIDSDNTNSNSNSNGNSDDESNYNADNIFNNSFKNIRSVNYDAKNDLWLVNLDIKNIHEANYSENSGNGENISESIVPSFNEFIKNRNFDKLVEDTAKVEKKLEYEHGDLKLLNYVITIEWTKNWVTNMVNFNERFPTFMYHDMHVMRTWAYTNTSMNYFYIGYFPEKVRLIHGPYYIAAVEVLPQKREFNVRLIIQNPNYMIDYEYDNKNKHIINFKNELRSLCQDSDAFFEFKDLKNFSSGRYYYSWLYE